MKKIKRFIQSSSIFRNPFHYFYAKLSRNRSEVGIVHLRNGAVFKMHMGNSDVNSITEIFGTNAYSDFFSKIKKGDTFVDIGANIGIISVAAALHGASIVAFEPNPHLIELLKENLSLNAVTGEVREQGVGAQSGKRNLNFTPTMWGGASFYKTDGDAILIDCVGINDFLDPLVSIDFMKIDIEGGEKEILDAVSTVNLGKIKNIFIEYHEPYASCDFVVNRLKEDGFAVTISDEFSAVVGKK